jgi:hypothetical protein
MMSVSDSSCEESILYTNRVGRLIATLAPCHESPPTGRRPDHPLPASLASAISATHRRPSSPTKTDKHQASPDREQRLLPSIVLGFLIYSLRRDERFSDPSSLVAWSWSGFPISYCRTQVPPRELVVRVMSSERHGRSGSSSRSSGHSPLPMHSFQAHGASVSGRPLFTTSLTVTDNRGRSIFATRVLVAQLTLIVPSFLHHLLFCVAATYSAPSSSLHSHGACSYCRRCTHRSSQKVCPDGAHASTSTCARKDFERRDMDCSFWYRQCGTR